MRFLALAALVLTGCGATASSSTTGSAPTRFMPDGPRTRATVWAIGDSAGGKDAPTVASLISRSKHDVVLYLGDVYPYGTGDAYEDSVAGQYGSLAKVTAPTPGNHDWPYRDEGYNPWWRGVKKVTTPPWYSFRAGGWQILSLNSEAQHGPTSPQVRYVKRATRSGGDCRLAFWHRPRFSAGKHGDQKDIEPLWHAVSGRAALVVNGHDHDMQRFLRYQGIVTLISGAGGHSLYGVDRGHPGLGFANDTVYGAVRIELTPGRARIAFYAADGRRLDSSTVRCRRS